MSEPKNRNLEVAFHYPRKSGRLIYNAYIEHGCKVVLTKEMSFPQTAVSVRVGVTERKPPARRSELEIKMDVLRVVASGIERPTQIMYKANLSWIALQSNLKSLVESSFLREENLGNRKRYELTQRGFEILGMFQKVAEAMGALPVVQGPAF